MSHTDLESKFCENLQEDREQLGSDPVGGDDLSQVELHEGWVLLQEG